MSFSSARAGAVDTGAAIARWSVSLVLVVMLCSRVLRRKWLRLVIELQPKEKREIAWEIVALLDENRVKLTIDGKFQPDWKTRPIPQSHIQLLVEHAVMNTDLAAYRSYPIGYLEFLFQLRGYKQQRHFKMPIVPLGARYKYDCIELTNRIEEDIKVRDL